MLASILVLCSLVLYSIGILPTAMLLLGNYQLQDDLDGIQTMGSILHAVLLPSFLPYLPSMLFLVSLGGMVGAIVSAFISAATPGPLKPWNKPMSYPAIGGKTTYNRTTFANFIEACGKKTIIFSTNRANGDISHPTDLQDITLINVTESMKIFITTPTTGWINPSDCVDMDCDELRKIVFKDIDGSFFGTVGGSLVSRSEYQWDGDRRYGLGKSVKSVAFLQSKEAIFFTDNILFEYQLGGNICSILLLNQSSSSYRLCLFHSSLTNSLSLILR